MDIILLTLNVDGCWELKQGVNNEFSLLSRMQTSQDLSNPTLKKIDSCKYAILAVIYCRT